MPSNVVNVNPECEPLMRISSTSHQSAASRNVFNEGPQLQMDSSDVQRKRSEDYETERTEPATDSSSCAVDLCGTSLVGVNSPLNNQLVQAVTDGNNISEIQRLLEANASPNAVDNSTNLNCVQIATISRRADILQLLFDHNANPKAVTEGKSLLHLAVELKDFNCLKVIMKVNSEEIETPLCAAVNAQWLDGVAELMNHRPDLEKRCSKSKKTVLQHAMVTKNPEVVKLIVSKSRHYENFSAIVNVMNDQGISPLFVAVLKNDLKLLKILLGADAKVMLLDTANRNVLHCAAELGNWQIMEELYKWKSAEMEQLAEQECRGKLKATPLQIAVARGNEKCVKYLIEEVKVSITNKTVIADHKDCNLLHLASDSDKPDALNYFASRLKNLANKTSDSDHPLIKLVHEVTSRGETPLHFALKRQQIDFIYALIAAGSDLTAKCVYKNKCSRTAIDILICQVPSAVEIISNVFDKSIKKMKKSTSVEVDYRVLMPRAVKEIEYKSGQTEIGQTRGDIAAFKGDRFGIMKALQKTGDRVGQRKLLEHPLVESFVHLHWNKLKGLYLTLVALNILYALFLSLFVLFRLTHNEQGMQWALGTLMLIFMALLLIHEFECISKPQPWGYYAESGIKWVCFCLSIAICFTGTPRELSAFAVLLAWLELVLLISRIPYYGHYMLMFIEIAFKYLKLLASFTFVLFGFVVAFMVIFGQREPFSSFWLGLVKIVVMMTNELEFDTFKDKFNENNPSMFSQILAMGVFIFFVVFISLVLTNLFVAVAVDDVKKLHLISKQASFLGVYDAFLLSEPSRPCRGIICLLFSGVCALVRPISPKIVNKWKYFGEVKSIYEIKVHDDEDVVRFPEDLSSALIAKGYENTYKIFKEYKESGDKLNEAKAVEKLKLEEKKNLLSEIEKMLSTFESKINSTLGN